MSVPDAIEDAGQLAKVGAHGRVPELPQVLPVRARRIEAERAMSVEGDEGGEVHGAESVAVPAERGDVRMQNVTPRLSETPGEIHWSGGDLGAHNAEVYAEFGIDETEQRRLAGAGAI